MKEKDDLIENYRISVKDNIQAEYFTITPQLRWIERKVFVSNVNIKDIQVLQQLHQGSLGNQQWVDVPTEIE